MIIEINGQITTGVEGQSHDVLESPGLYPFTSLGQTAEPEGRAIILRQLTRKLGNLPP